MRVRRVRGQVPDQPCVDCLDHSLATVAFILAPDVGVLIVGRILSGLSAGLMTGAATAALTELIPASRRASLVATAVNTGGTGLGPLIAGLFAQYAPHPTVLVFAVYLAVLVAAGMCLRPIRKR